MSEVKVNKISPRTACGTVTLGDSGDTIAIGAGVTTSGMGRAGAVDWQTGSIKTGSFTPTSGEGYFVNTSGGTATANLPAGSAGAIVAFSDYTRTFGTNSLTISANGSEKIGGITDDVVLSTNGQALTLVYVDGTEGWVNVQNATDTEGGSDYIVATGGTITTVCTNYKVHTFTGPGTFEVTAGKGPLSVVDYLVIAGGAAGGGGADGAGGGGAGGYRFTAGTSSGCYAAGPAPLANTALAVTKTSYPITVGAGGSPNPATANAVANNGSNSIFSSITSTGGGSGGLGDINPACGASAPGRAVNAAGAPGGSGGGGGTSSPGTPGQGTVGSGNTPAVPKSQGNNGGTGATDNSNYRVGGGGGGASATGINVCNPAPAGGVGGAGLASTINATPTTRAGGGGGGGHPQSSRNGGAGGAGGGGNGARYGGPPYVPATAATVNTGSGGGGSGHISGGTASGGGGSGIVIIRYKFQ